MQTRRGHMYQKTKGGTWYVRTMIDKKLIVRSLGTKNKRQAVKRRDEIMRPYVLGDQAAVLKATVAKLNETETEQQRIEAALNPPPEIARAWDRFLESPARPDSGEATLIGYESKWRRFTAWLAKHHPDVNHLHEVSSPIASEYAADLTASKRSASSFNQHRNLLRMVWRVMADDSRLTVNVWDRVTSKRLNALATRKRALTPAQYDALLAAVEGDADLRDFFTLLAWTGQRRGDIVLLKWGSVDFKTRVITLAPMKTARRQGKQVHIPMFPATIEVLDRRQAGQVLNPAGYVFEDMAADYMRDASQLSKRITKAFEAAGMETSEVRADRGRQAVVFGAHSFRHLFVSAASSAGMPAAMIKSITGHATDEMMQHYQHLGVELASELATRIGNGNGVKSLSEATGAATHAETPIKPGTQATSEMRRILEAMTGRTWRADRDALLAMLN